MVKAANKIPEEVIKEIFPRKLIRSRTSDWVYSQLKRMILAGKLKQGQRLILEEISENFNISRVPVTAAFFQLKKEGLIISEGRKGSFVA
jgi:DNA-binding GntR family transcriptional regulator